MTSSASRTFDTPMTWTKGVVDYFCKVQLGTTGAVTSIAGKGVASVTRTAAGRYVIVMLDSFVSSLHVEVTVQRTSTTAYGAGKATVFQVIGTTGNTGTFTIQGLNGVTDADADDAAALSIRITYKNSSAF